MAFGKLVTKFKEKKEKVREKVAEIGKRGSGVNQTTVLAIAIIAASLILGGFIVYNQAQQAKTLSILYQQQRTYNGKINATFVQNIPDIGAVTAGTISADGTTVTIAYKPDDIIYGRADRMVYFKVKIDGKIQNLDISGDKVSTALDLTVAQDKTGVVYADPEQYTDALKSMETVTVNSDGEFDIHIPVDTYNVPVDAVYVGVDFRLLENPSVTSLSATKIYDIKISAEKADSDFNEVHLYVDGEYNVTA